MGGGLCPPACWGTGRVGWQWATRGGPGTPILERWVVYPRRHRATELRGHGAEGPRRTPKKMDPSKGGVAQRSTHLPGLGLPALPCGPRGLFQPQASLSRRRDRTPLRGRAGEQLGSLVHTRRCPKPFARVNSSKLHSPMGETAFLSLLNRGGNRGTESTNAAVWWERTTVQPLGDTVWGLRTSTHTVTTRPRSSLPGNTPKRRESRRSSEHLYTNSHSSSTHAAYGGAPISSRAGERMAAHCADLHVRGPARGDPLYR